MSISDYASILLVVNCMSFKVGSTLSRKTIQSKFPVFKRGYCKRKECAPLRSKFFPFGEDVFEKVIHHT